MERYRDLSGCSGVAAYEIGDDWIAVEFKTGAAYLYTEASAGARRVEEMKTLADAAGGSALSSPSRWARPMQRS